MTDTECAQIARSNAREMAKVESFLAEEDRRGFADYLFNRGEIDSYDQEKADLSDLLLLWVNTFLEFYAEGRTYQGEWDANKAVLLVCYGGPNVWCAIDKYGTGDIRAYWCSESATHGFSAPNLAQFLWGLLGNS